MKTIIITLIIILGISLFQKSYSRATTIKSNIIFVDCKPDISLNTETDTLKIDINGDYINDVGFYLFITSGGDWSYVEPLNENCYITSLSYQTNDSLKSDSVKWVPTSFIFLAEFNRTEKIGVRISSNGSIYYGWIKVYYNYIGWNKVIYIDKYAFCTIPNYPLLWGQTNITDTGELKEEANIKVYVTDSGNQLVVQSGDILKSIRIINLLGETVVAKDNIRDNRATLSTKDLIHGTYIVKVTNSKLKEYTSKFVF